MELRTGSAERRWNTGVELTWPNFWESEVTGRLLAAFPGRAADARWTVDGKAGRLARGRRVESSDASSTRGEFAAAYGRDEDGGLEFEAEIEIALQPAPQWELSISPRYVRQVGTQQYVTTLAGGGAATFGSRYIFGHIDRSTYSTGIRFNYTFKPDLTLDLYAEPFSASGRYDHLGELAAVRTRQIRRYGTDGTTITRLPMAGARSPTERELRVARPRLQRAVVPQQSRAALGVAGGKHPVSRLAAGSMAEESRATRTTPRQMFSSFGAPGDNLFAVKASFWLSPR